MYLLGCSGVLAASSSEVLQLNLCRVCPDWHLIWLHISNGSCEPTGVDRTPAQLLPGFGIVQIIADGEEVGKDWSAIKLDSLLLADALHRQAGALDCLDGSPINGSDVCAKLVSNCRSDLLACQPLLACNRHIASISASKGSCMA